MRARRWRCGCSSARKRRRARQPQFAKLVVATDLSARTGWADEEAQRYERTSRPARRMRQTRVMDFFGLEASSPRRRRSADDATTTVTRAWYLRRDTAVPGGAMAPGGRRSR
jgi:hypothetical protein